MLFFRLLFIFLAVFAAAGRNPCGGLFEQFEVYGGGCGLAEIEIAVRNKAVYNGTGIFPFGLIMLGYFPSRVSL